MPSSPSDNQPRSWDRYFAIQSNNRAWDLATTLRSHDQDLEMLNAAHASAWHWSVVGSELHKVRAKMLLARVHALLGYASTAWAFADEVRAYFVEHGAAPWELAFAHAIYAHAAYISGNGEEHRAAYDAALAATFEISEAEDRRVFEETFALIPAP